MHKDSTVAEEVKEKTDEIQDKETPAEELPEQQQQEVSTDTTPATPAQDEPQQPEEAPANTDDTGAQQLQNDGQESTYANLQPIFLAMEMGQDAIHATQHGEQPSTTAELSQSTQAVQVSQAMTEHTNQMVFSQQVLNNLATSVAEGSASVSLQSILQVIIFANYSSISSWETLMPLFISHYHQLAFSIF